MKTRNVILFALLAQCAMAFSQTGAKEIIPQAQPKPSQGQAHCPL